MEHRRKGVEGLNDKLEEGRVESASPASWGDDGDGGKVVTVEIVPPWRSCPCALYLLYLAVGTAHLTLRQQPHLLPLLEPKEASSSHTWISPTRVVSSPAPSRTPPSGSKPTGSPVYDQML